MKIKILDSLLLLTLLTASGAANAIMIDRGNRLIYVTVVLVRVQRYQRGRPKVAARAFKTGRRSAPVGHSGEADKRGP